MYTWIFATGVIFAFYNAWGGGANDCANSFATAVGSKTLTLKKAVLVASVFEFTGAVLMGSHVTDSVRKNIVSLDIFEDDPGGLMLGMLCADLASAIWLTVATYLRWPVSTTHSIIGAIIGFALVAVGTEAIQWNKVGGIVGSWIITPAISGFIAYLIFMSAQKLIFDTDAPLKNAKRFVPLYMGLAGFIMALVTIKKGLKHIGINLGATEGYLIAIAIALIVAIIGKIAISRLNIDPKADKQMQFNNVEKVFAVLMVLTACCMAFAHGSNDVANAIGPLAAVVNIVESNGEIAKKAAIAWWILPLGGFGIVAGLAILGKKVIKTIGEGITHLTPSRGFAAELAAASTVVIASGTGMPISTTQTLVGAVLGVGMARGIAALNMGVIRNIVVSWVITLPVGAALAIVIFYVLRTAFGV